jgi:hypothetical protein
MLVYNFGLETEDFQLSTAMYLFTYYPLRLDPTSLGEFLGVVCVPRSRRGGER